MSLFLMLAVGLGIAADGAPQPSETQLALYKALSVRHFEQGCASLDSLSPTVASDLVWLAENATQPSWVAVRAADCVLERHSAASLDSVRRWMQTPETKGLALVTVQHLDRMDVQQASGLVDAALAGPMADALRPRLAKLERPELRALVVSP